MTGTFIKIITVIIGSLIGVFFGSKLPALFLAPLIVVFLDLLFH